MNDHQMDEPHTQINEGRPLFIDAVRFHFIRSILFDCTESKISINLGSDGTPCYKTDLSVKLPLPDIFPINSIDWREEYIDSVVDYWIDRSALGLLSQCVDEWKKLDFSDVHSALKTDADRYVVSRAAMLDAINDAKIHPRKSNGSVMSINCELPTSDQSARHLTLVLSNPKSECDDVLKAFEAAIDDAKSKVLTSKKIEMNVSM